MNRRQFCTAGVILGSRLTYAWADGDGPTPQERAEGYRWVAPVAASATGVTEVTGSFERLKRGKLLVALRPR